MPRRYLTDAEYRGYFFVLGNVREAIANDITDLAGKNAKKILDIASGHGLFAFELSTATAGRQIIGTGLENDKKTYMDISSLIRGRGVSCLPHVGLAAIEGIQYVVSDVTSLPFKDGSFDCAANFLGLEDVRMTRRDEGVRNAIKEAARVTRAGGIVEFAVQVFGDDPVDILSKEIMEYVGHGAVFLGPAIYEAMLEDADLKVVSRKRYSTGAVLTARQAMEELRYTCQETGRVYGKYGVTTRAFSEVWEKFGRRIETYGYALYTDILGFFCEKR